MIALDAASCTGCKMCMKVCPHGVIEMQGSVAVLVHEARCIECGACQLNCHDGAIEVSKGTGCLFAIVKEDILGLRPAEAV